MLLRALASQSEQYYAETSGIPRGCRGEHYFAASRTHTVLMLVNSRMP